MYCREIEAPRVGDTARQPRAVWQGIAARIRRGDPDAVADFDQLCRPGIRLLLKLNVSGVGLDRLVEETVDGAVDGIRQGWIREPRHLASFVRGVIERAAWPGARPGATDQARVRQRAQEMEEALGRFAPVEREWLKRFYLDGWDLPRILEASGMTVDEFADLRQRLRATAGLSTRRDAPAVPMARAAGA
jgi:hypothetical protein